MTHPLLPLGLCLVSAICVAGANLFVKRGGDVLIARMVMSMSMALTALPFAFFVPLPSGPLWGFIALSVLAHLIYQFAVIRALHRGDLSLVFPFMRGLAPLITAIIATFVLQETPSLLGWAGLCVATLALIVFALPEGEAVGHTPLKKAALIWAGITSFGIALYSVMDAYGIRQAEVAATFIVWLFLFDWIGVTLTALVTRRGHFWADLRPQIMGGFIGGVIGAISYAAALWAFTMTEAATVAAIRETSVVFGAIFGAVFLKEAFGRRRIIAACILSMGLLMLEIGL